MMRGWMTPDHAVYAIVGMVILAAIANALGTTVLRMAFTVGIPLTAAALLIVQNTDGSSRQVAALAGSFAALAIALFGLYLMVRSFFR